jgi:hypothetical protein
VNTSYGELRDRCLRKSWHFKIRRKKTRVRTQRERKSFKREQTIAPTREGEKRGRELGNSAHLVMKKETGTKIVRETRDRSES